jgi:general secretion pathway protein H
VTPPTSSGTDPGRSSPRASVAGFALFELMLTLALIALIASLALPRARPFDGGAALRVKAYETAALLRADRDAALRSDRDVASRVDLASKRLSAGATRDAVLYPDAMTLRLVTPRLDGFRFFRNGRSTGGELTIGAGRQSLSITVDEWTSAVAIRAADERAP